MSGYTKYVVLNALAGVAAALEASFPLIQANMRPACYVIFFSVLAGANVALRMLAAKPPTDPKEES